MNILLIHNYYKERGGEESIVEMQQKLFTEKGHNLVTYFRRYDEQYAWRLGKWRALASSLGNRKAAREVEALVKEHNIRVALVHNIYPLLSPRVITTLHSLGVRVIYVAHNFRLLCPNALFYTHGGICEKCTGCGKELHSIANRCEGSLLGSMVYALRSYVARRGYRVIRSIDKVVTLTSFAYDKFREYGVDSSQLITIGNSCSYPLNEQEGKRNPSVLFVGRLSQEKGVATLLAAARALPNTPFVVAGGGDIDPSWGTVPPNVTLLGRVDKEKLVELYRSASLVAITSNCYESFPLSIMEAAYSRTPVVVPAMGAMGRLVQHEVTGLCYTPYSIESLVDNISRLLADRSWADSLALNLQQECLANYSLESYYERYCQLWRDLE